MNLAIGATYRSMTVFDSFCVRVMDNNPVFGVGARLGAVSTNIPCAPRFRICAVWKHASKAHKCENEALKGCVCWQRLNGRLLQTRGFSESKGAGNNFVCARNWESLPCLCPWDLLDSVARALLSARYTALPLPFVAGFNTQSRPAALAAAENMWVEYRGSDFNDIKS